MRTILTFVLLLPLTASAADLTFRQALQKAWEHSHTLKKDAASTDASQASLHAAQADRWPTLSLSGAAQFLDDIPVVQFAPGLTRELGAKENFQTDFRLNLPLFTGGRITSGVELSRAGRELTSALAKGDSDRVAYTVWSEYLGLQRADRMVEVAQASLRRAEIIAADVSSLLAAGVADSIDFNDTRLALARAQLGVTQAKNNRRLAELRTAILIGADLSDPLSPATTPPSPASIASLDVSPVSDVGVSPLKGELRAADANVNAAKARVRLTAADFLPTLSAYGGYSYGKPNGDFFNNDWRDYWTAGASVNWSFNLGGKAMSRNRSARYDLLSAQSEQRWVAEQIDGEARLAVEQVRLSLARYQSSVTEYGIASDQFRQAQQRHQNGDLSSNRLLDIETSLTAAQSSLAASVADFWLSMAYWYYAIGSNKLQEGF